jgi:hypothetical protein
VCPSPIDESIVELTEDCGVWNSWDSLCTCLAFAVLGLSVDNAVPAMVAITALALCTVRGGDVMVGVSLAADDDADVSNTPL